MNTTRRNSERARGQSTQQEGKRNIRAGQMNGYKWRKAGTKQNKEKPATVGEELQSGRPQRLERLERERIHLL